MAQRPPVPDPHYYAITGEDAMADEPDRSVPAVREHGAEVGGPIPPHPDCQALVSFEDAERLHMSPGKRDGVVPFGHGRRQWLDLRAKAREGDELWTFCTPSESWHALRGRAGYALFRNGVEIGRYVTLMN